MTIPTHPTKLHIRRAKCEDAHDLTRLTWDSKAYWGYDEAFMAKARLTMFVTAESISINPVYIIEDASGLLGYYELLPTEITYKGWLESLFVLPRAIGAGCGKLLWQHLSQTAIEQGYTCLEFEADPNAEGFYLRMGAYRIGQRESGIVAGRMLPLMRYDLTCDSRQ